jgi:hypothetical protein
MESEAEAMGELTLTGDKLVVAIRREHVAASAAARSALEHALECGRLLAQARAEVPHGGWERYLSDTCGIAPRTGRLYLRLHEHRDRLGNRQRVAGLTVREAARLVAEPRLVVATDEQADELRLRVPEWYRHGHRHYGEHPSGWIFEVWPHPAGEQWAHFYVCSPTSGYPGDESATLSGPKRGIRVDALEWAMGWQAANGMPSLDDAAWSISDSPCRLDDAFDRSASRFKHYNTLLFAGDEDYRRRGMGIEPSSRKAASGAALA